MTAARVRTLIRSSIVSACAIACCAGPARAQPPGRIEVSGGTRWYGSTSFGEIDANETAPGGALRPLFKSSTDLDRSFGGELHVGVMLTRAVEIEGAIALNRTSLTTHATSDVEGAADTTATESITQYVFEGGGLLQPAQWRFGKLAPFAAAGAGHVRQLHEGHALVDTGTSFYVGGGLRYPFTEGRAGRVKAAGVRIDARAAFTARGVAPDDKVRAAPQIGASLYVRF